MVDSICPPGLQLRLHVRTSLTTGGGPLSFVQLPRGVLRWFTRLACGSVYPQLSKSCIYDDMASKMFTFTLHRTNGQGNPLGHI